MAELRFQDGCVETVIATGDGLDMVVEANEGAKCRELYQLYGLPDRTPSYGCHSFQWLRRGIPPRDYKLYVKE